ncbi:septal ring lytic transglycosylase RlpA family protein [Algimonas arctica]|nr:septal ring lytic transglycosylase RlpA family protein [Algimonas arctica]
MTKTSSSAPITYKVGQGDAQYASLDRSNRSSRPSAPRSYDPAGGQGRDFDPQRIDRTLYSHQKVGNRYTIMGRSYTPKHDPDYNETGQASWYGPGFHGKPTANGETFDKNAMTAAHKTLPLNSMVRVTNLDNGRTIIVRLNDRGPFIGERIIDMSEAAAGALGYTHDGVANVRVRYLGPADPSAGTRVLPRNAPRVASLPRENMKPAPRYVAPQPMAPRYIDPCENDRPHERLAPASCKVAQSLPSLPPYQAPNPAPVVPTPAPRYAAPSLPNPIARGNPRRAPEADLPSGGDITMTIKGPIHIAGSKDTDLAPEFITGPLKTK